MSTATKLITAEEFARLDIDRPCELVRGVVVERDYPFPRHGAVCSRVSHLLYRHVKRHDIGRVFCNNSGVILERNPDTVRGPDVWYMSFKKQPRGRLPHVYLNEVPDVAIEVLSPRVGQLFE